MSINNTEWQPITYWNHTDRLDVSKLDELYAAWLRYRKLIEKYNQAFEDYKLKLSRIHAIETGVIENLYTVSRGVTELLIKEGFKEALISHADSNVGTRKLLNYINDNKEAIDFIFDTVSSGRKLSTSFIKELHQLVTRHQDSITVQDESGRLFEKRLTKGTYKTTPNNPKRLDGTVFMYCPPDFVTDEMDRLIKIYEEKSQDENTHPLVLAAFFHHAFTLIHPFEDGNGRLARLLTSMLLIKAELFPFTILRNQKSEYIVALELADAGEPQALVTLIASNQRQYIDEALNIAPTKFRTIDLLANAFAKKVQEQKEQATSSKENKLAKSRIAVIDTITQHIDNIVLQLRNNNLPFSIVTYKSTTETEHYYKHQIINYATRFNYFFKANEPRNWVGITLAWNGVENYKITFTCHHFGYSNDLWAIGAFMSIEPFLKPNTNALENNASDSNIELILSETKPYIIDLLVDNLPPKVISEITQNVEDTITQFMSLMLDRSS